MHDAGELLPRPAPAAEARLPQAADPDDAEVAAAPQARRVAARRDGGRARPSTACCGTTRSCSRARRSSSPRTTRSAASCCARARSITTSRGAREARHRRRLSAARRAALSVPGEGAGHRARAASRTPRSSGARKSPRTWAPGPSSSPISNGCSPHAGVKAKRARYAGRPASAATATGLMSKHLAQLNAFLEEVFAA